MIKITRIIFGSSLRWVIFIGVFFGCVSGKASISEGPNPKNAVEERQRQKLLFDQAVESNQDKLRVGKERYDRKVAERAQMLQVMSAQLEARKAVVVLQPPPTTPKLADVVSGTQKPILTLILLTIMCLCIRHVYQQYRREHLETTDANDSFN